jgi:hypothetical protein
MAASQSLDARWSIVPLILGAGIAGGALAMVLALWLIPGRPRPYLVVTGIAQVAETAVAVAVAAGGALAGMFVVFAVLGRTHGRLRCPQCNTPNDQDAPTCAACGLRIGPV